MRTESTLVHEYRITLLGREIGRGKTHTKAFSRTIRTCMCVEEIDKRFYKLFGGETHNSVLANGGIGFTVNAGNTTKGEAGFDTSIERKQKGRQSLRRLLYAHDDDAYMLGKRFLKIGVKQLPVVTELLPLSKILQIERPRTKSVFVDLPLSPLMIDALVKDQPPRQ